MNSCLIIPAFLAIFWSLISSLREMSDPDLKKETWNADWGLQTCWELLTKANPLLIVNPFCPLSGALFHPAWEKIQGSCVFLPWWNKSSRVIPKLIWQENGPWREYLVSIPFQPTKFAAHHVCILRWFCFVEVKATLRLLTACSDGYLLISLLYCG